MPGFTDNERTDMVLCLGARNGNAREAATLYQRRFPDRLQPAKDTIVTAAANLRLYGQFRKPYSVEHRRSRRADRDIQILAAVSSNPHCSSRSIGLDLDVSHSTVLYALHRHHYHPYHVHLHQALHGEDWMRRIEFCMYLQEELERDTNFLQRVLMTDESTFHRDGVVNIHNAHYWSATNPHWLREAHHQVRFKVNVWCGIHNDRVLGPVFLPHLTGDTYLHFLQSDLQDYLDDLPVARLRNMIFQHDGAPAHYDRRVRAYLDQQFPNKWIGRGGPVTWPPRSPDLSPLDFFLWGYVKSQVYATEPTSVEDLQDRIRASIASISPDMLRRVRSSVTKRVEDCLTAGGWQFEHLNA